MLLTSVVGSVAEGEGVVLDDYAIDEGYDRSTLYPMLVDAMPVMWRIQDPQQERGQIVLGPEGNLWFTEPRAGKIGRISAAGQTTEFPVFTNSNLDGSDYVGNAITFGADGNLYFAVHQEAGWVIGRLTTEGQYTRVTEPQEAGIGDVVVGAEGNIWFAQGDGKIGRVNADNTVSLFAVEKAIGIAHLTAGSDGQLGFVAYDKQNIFGKIAMDGTITPVSGGFFANAYINDLVAGPDGRMYLAADGAIGAISAEGQFTVTSLPQVYVVNLALGGDGSFWFIDGRESLNPLARLKDGVVMHFAIPDNSARIAGIALDSTGRVWLTGADSGEIQSVQVRDTILGQTARVNVEHRKQFTKTVGSFVDLGATPTSAYAASIDWGDGQSSAGSVVANPNGGYDVIATGSLRRGWHHITITITADDRTATVESSVYAVPPAMAGKGVTIGPTAGQIFNGTVATYVGLDTENLDWYSAIIYWGDGENSPAQLIPGDNDNVQINGTHTYAKPGLYDIQIYVQESDPNAPPALRLGFVPTTSFNDARSRAVVAPGLLDGKLIPRITVGVKGPVLAEFTIADSADMADHYAAAIRWGSGQEEQGTIEPTDPGTFTVRTSRVFLESKYEQLTISIYDLNRSKHFGTVGIVKGSIFVQTHLSLLVNTLTATAGQEFNGVVATLRSIGTGTLWSSQFSALIDWGDGQSSPGQVVANDSGGWDVVGFHTYEITGYHERRSVNVRVEETRTPLDPSLPAPEHAYVVAARSSNSWQILPGDIEGFRLHALGWTDSATAGQGRYLFLATLTAQEPDAQFGDFTGQVNWDDGGVSPAFVNYNYGYDFTIHSSYLFATAGKHTGTLTITGAGFTHSIEVEVEVREPVPPPPPPPPPLPPLARIHPQSIAAVVGVEFSGILATFIPRDAEAKPADFTVSIYWGDGGSSDGVITLDSQGRFVISGSHIYHREYTGDYHWFDMTLRRGSESRWERGNFTVVRNPNFVYAEGRDDLHFRQHEELTTKVASFTPIAGKGLEDYQALIDWGDGRVTPGTISEGYDGWLDVSGATTYQRDGTLTIKVTIKGPGGPVEAQSSIRLDHDPVVVNPVQPAVNELEVRGILASFTDADGGSTAEYQVTYAALIDWGDGLITSGTVAAAADGSQQVSGSHIYVAPGDYRVRLIVRRNMRQLPRLAPPPGYSPSYSFRWEWIYDGDFAWGITLSNASYNSAESIDEAEYGHFLYTLHLARSASGGDVGGQSQDSRGKKKARRARISGTVFRDANANGRRDKKEARLAGWRVFLDLDRDGVFDKAEPSTVTDERGRYVFGKAPSGKQMVRVVPRRGTLAKGKGGARALRVIEGRILNGQHVGIQGAKVVDR